MKILLIVLFNEHQLSKYNQYEGTYGLVTDDINVLKFHNKNTYYMSFSDIYSEMQTYFFSEYDANKYAADKYLNEKFKRIGSILLNTENNFNHIVYCEVS